MMKEFWNKLDFKQRKMVMLAVVVVAGALMLEIIIFPFWEAKTKLDRSIQSHRKKMVELKNLDEAFAVQREKISAIRQYAAARGSDFSLFSYLEKKAALTGVRGNIKQMTSAKGVSSAAFEESLVDIKLEKITIKQLADFLAVAESPAELVRIKRVVVTKMKESPEYLSAQLQVSSFQPLAVGREP